jgi:hypothetical protein
LTPKSYGPWLFWMLWPWDETTPATKAKNVTWMRSASQIYLLRATSAFIELALLFCFVALLKGTETLEKIQRKIDHENLRNLRITIGANINPPVRIVGCIRQQKALAPQNDHIFYFFWEDRKTM